MDGQTEVLHHRRPPSKRPSGDALGFSVHAHVHVAENDVEGQQRLCRYAARPPLADAQLSETNDGRIAVKLRKPRGASTHIVLHPVAFLRRLAWLIPHPTRHQVRYSGVFAPNAKWRASIVPGYCDPHGESAEDPIFDEAPREPVVVPIRSGAAAIPWRALLARVYDVDPLICECGGVYKPIAVILDPKVAQKILRSLGQNTMPPRFAPARAPP